MIRALGLIFCGTGFLNCVALFITIQAIKDSYPTTPPEWLILWFLATGLVSAFGLIFVILHCLGVE